ncbi:MAG TPA: BT4734/BF3469 family protein [Nitrososphaeraceae archaeon]|nr:BT4734/BF3469 family protein [Nitrososphaeraceae archaeon]
MSYLDTVSFQFFSANIYDAIPRGTLTLRQFLDVHKNPKESTIEVIEQIKIAAKNNDLKLKDSLKQNNLYSFIPSVILNGEGRRLIDIVDFNPVMLVEFDKIDNSLELKERLFNNLKSVIAAWISPSGRGLKLLIRIPKPTSVENYKEYYCGLAFYLSQYDGFDGVNFNIVLPLFLSYDKEILIREDAEEWTQRGGKINAFQIYEGEFEVPEYIEDNIKHKITDKITFLVNQIDDNAHPRIRNIATIFGGFCSQYGFNIDEADDLICDLIAENEYMKKNPRGYCKTAKEFLRKGFLSPIELD